MAKLTGRCISGIALAIGYSLCSIGTAHSEVTSSQLTNYRGKEFTGSWPVDWTITSMSIADFTIYQVLDTASVPGSEIEIFGVYSGTSIKSLKLTPYTIERCVVDGMTLTFGRSDASATQSGMTHILAEKGTGGDKRVVHIFSTMLDLTSPSDLAERQVSLNVLGSPLQGLYCPQ